MATHRKIANLRGPRGSLQEDEQALLDQAIESAPKVAADADRTRGYAEQLEQVFLDGTEGVNDAAVGTYVRTPGTGTRGAVLGAIGSEAGFWGDMAISALDQMAPPAHTPSISYASGHSESSISSPVEYRPVVCGTGAQVVDWDGQNDPAMVFHPGVFRTGNGFANDLALNGDYKPGGQSQDARWPIIVEFDTSTQVQEVEISVFGSRNPDLGLEVNGLRSVSPYTISGPSGLGSGKRVLLTFPTARSRRIRLYLNGGVGLHTIRVNSGGTISKPAEAPRAGVVIGDSYANGAGVADAYPSGAGEFDTFALRTLKVLGCNRFILAGIGGTGFVAGGSTRAYHTRIDGVLNLSPAPEVLVVNGSINDGGAAGGIQEAVESFLDSTSSIPERHVIGTMRSAYRGNHGAVAAAAASAEVPFIPMLDFLSGSGNVTAPNGTGNADLLIMGDGVHPTLPGHTAISARIIAQLTRSGS